VDGEDDIQRWERQRLAWHRALMVLLVALPVLWLVGGSQA
jgi:hypothetical protein